MTKGKRIRSSAKLLKQRQVNAHWDDSNTCVFVRLCAEQVHLGNRPGTHLNDKGWDQVIAAFEKITKLPYTYQQLKNKWDNLKRDWTTWQHLVGKEIGLGRDPATGAITAPDSWWAQKMMGNKDVQKFRHKPLLEADKMAVIFQDITATGEFSYAPSSGRSPPPDRDVSPQAISDNSRSNFAGPRSPVISPASTRPSPMASSSKRPKGVQKNKRRRHHWDSSGPSNTDDLARSFEHFREYLGESDATSPTTDKANEKVYSIEECMKVVTSIEAEFPNEPGWVDGYLCAWAGKILEKQVKRQVFMSFRTNEGRLRWIQLEKQFAEDALEQRRMANNMDPRQQTYPYEPASYAHFGHPYQPQQQFPHTHFAGQLFCTPQQPYTPHAYPFSPHPFAPPPTTQQQPQPFPPTSSPSHFQEPS